MASLYIYKNKELKSFVQQPWLIDELLYDYKIPSQVCRQADSPIPEWACNDRIEYSHENTFS